MNKYMHTTFKMTFQLFKQKGLCIKKMPLKKILKGSVTVRYIFVHCRFMSLFAKISIRLRYIKLHIDRFVMIIRTLS